MLGVLCSDQRKNGQIDDASSSQLGGGGGEEETGRDTAERYYKGHMYREMLQNCVARIMRKGDCEAGKQPNNAQAYTCRSAVCCFCCQLCLQGNDPALLVVCRDHKIIYLLLI